MGGLLKEMDLQMCTMPYSDPQSRPWDFFRLHVCSSSTFVEVDMIFKMGLLICTMPYSGIFLGFTCVHHRHLLK